MKTLILIALTALAALAQAPPPPTITAGSDAPNPGLCSAATVGGLYVRSQNPANGPIGVFRCTQNGGPYSVNWLPVGHFSGATLPTYCTKGELAFKTGEVAGAQLFVCSATDTWTAGGFGWIDDGTNIATVSGRTVSIANLLAPISLTTSGGVLSGTYTSGITATGATGTTCLLTSLNGAGSSATARVALTSTNTIAGSTALVITAAGSGYTSAPTSSTASAGTATTCSGTAVIATAISSSPTASGNYYHNTAGDMTYLLPTITSATIGTKLCFRNYTARTGVITLQLPASTTVDVDGTAGTAAGTLVSGGAGGDAACVLAATTTKYIGYVEHGTWTNN